MAYDLEVLSDPAAERALLSGIFKYRHQAFCDVSDIIKGSSFTIESNVGWYRCLEHILSQSDEAIPDAASMLSSAKSLGLDSLLDSPDERRHLRAIMTMPVEEANLRRLAGKVRKLELARDGIAVTEQVKEGLLKVTGDEPAETIVGLLENPVTEFTTNLAGADSQGPRRVGDGLAAYIEHLALNPVRQVGLSTGWKKFDVAIGGGLRPGTINVIGARAKGGKSLGKVNIGWHVAHRLATPVLDLDTEMSWADHLTRMTAVVSGLPIKSIETGSFGSDPKARQAVDDAVAKMESAPYEFKSIAGQPFEETLATMGRWVRKTVGLRPDGKANPCLIVFDYLKLMSADGLSRHVQEFQLLGFMMTGLHNFAVKYGVPILLLVQLNRDGLDSENEAAVSGSDRIIWLCSNFSILKGQSDEEYAAQAGNKVKYNRKLVPVVARHGPGMDGRDYINVSFDKDVGRMFEGPTSLEMSGGLTNDNGGAIGF